MRAVTLSMIGLLLAAPAPAAAGAWWTTERFQPEGSEIADLPVASISRGWKKASPLTAAKLSPDGRRYLATERDPFVRDSAFDVSGDFNRDRRPDRALVGVYETKQGEKGRFVLVVTTGKDGTWEKSYLDTIPGDPGFSILNLTEGRLTWTTCFECDLGAEITWENDHYETEFPEDEEE